MSTADSPASPASPKTQPAQLSGGLHLTGTVIAVRTEEKEWEKEKYTQTTVSISDGEQVYLMRHRHDSKPWSVPGLFQPIKVRVTRATTEKGQIAHAKGELTLKTTKVPAKTWSMSPAAIARIRRKLKASTPVFVAYLNVTPDTVRSWEKNRRHPSGPALRLLQIAEKQPELLLVSA